MYAFQRAEEVAKELGVKGLGFRDLKCQTFNSKLLTNHEMGGCQNYGQFLGTLNIRGHIRIGIQKGTILLTTIQILKLQVLPDPKSIQP